MIIIDTLILKGTIILLCIIVIALERRLIKVENKQNNK